MIIIRDFSYLISKSKFKVFVRYHVSIIRDLSYLTVLVNV